MLTWEEIKKRFKDEWVVMTDWEEDTYGDVIKGKVAYHHPKQNTFYDHLKKKFHQKSLAIRYTGNIRGPFFLSRQ